MEFWSSLLLEVWDAVIDLLPNSKREDMAGRLVDIFADKGMERDDFEAIRGEDGYLDSAIDVHYTGESDDEHYDEHDYDEDH
jgi:hypothetical protein